MSFDSLDSDAMHQMHSRYNSALISRARADLPAEVQKFIPSTPHDVRVTRALEEQRVDAAHLVFLSQSQPQDDEDDAPNESMRANTDQSAVNNDEASEDNLGSLAYATEFPSLSQMLGPPGMYAQSPYTGPHTVNGPIPSESMGDFADTARANAGNAYTSAPANAAAPLQIIATPVAPATVLSPPLSQTVPALPRGTDPQYAASPMLAQQPPVSPLIPMRPPVSSMISARPPASPLLSMSVSQLLTQTPALPPGASAASASTTTASSSSSSSSATAFPPGRAYPPNKRARLQPNQPANQRQSTHVLGLVSPVEDEKEFEPPRATSERARAAAAAAATAAATTASSARNVGRTPALLHFDAEIAKPQYVAIAAYLRTALRNAVMQDVYIAEERGHSRARNEAQSAGRSLQPSAAAAAAEGGASAYAATASSAAASTNATNPQQQHVDPFGINTHESIDLSGGGGGEGGYDAHAAANAPVAEFPESGDYPPPARRADLVSVDRARSRRNNGKLKAKDFQTQADLLQLTDDDWTYLYFLRIRKAALGRFKGVFQARDLAKLSKEQRFELRQQFLRAEPASANESAMGYVMLLRQTVRHDALQKEKVKFDANSRNQLSTPPPDTTNTQDLAKYNQDIWQFDNIFSVFHHPVLQQGEARFGDRVPKVINKLLQAYKKQQDPAVELPQVQMLATYRHLAEQD